jgi:hypothetical protein
VLVVEAVAAINPREYDLVCGVIAAEVRQLGFTF